MNFREGVPSLKFMVGEGQGGHALPETHPLQEGQGGLCPP
jgi:hypothetical protein